MDIRDGADPPVSRRTVVRATAGLVVMNLVAVVAALEIILAQNGVSTVSSAWLDLDELWMPFVPVVLGLALVNGLALSRWPPGRVVGRGVLIGSLLASGVFVVWWYFLVLNSFA